MDGYAVACGANGDGQCNVPYLEHDGVRYSQVSAGACHTVFLRSDGRVVACGNNTSCQCSLPGSVLAEFASLSQVPRFAMDPFPLPVMPGTICEVQRYFDAFGELQIRPVHTDFNAEIDV